MPDLRALPQGAWEQLVAQYTGNGQAPFFQYLAADLADRRQANDDLQRGR